ncbi:hypothetical protein KC717_03660 [Candidatus Dojkabacteria bacterium]|uniref:DUF11 domain-containing protein n=1 Tax=Candidatus Dojkabacteria bacterium TaxID=2099670 RepID=A0A955L811_9BACT|nr:hypothetical protein [Candidatus Dojkabacteria bacterium]
MHNAIAYLKHSSVVLSISFLFLFFLFGKYSPQNIANAGTCASPDVLVGQWSGQNRIVPFDGVTDVQSADFITGLSTPHEFIYANGNSLFVADTGNSQVVEYNGTTGALVGTIMDNGSDGLSQPYGLAADSDYLFVLDRANRILYRYEFATTTVTTLWSHGNPNQYTMGLVVGPNGNIFVGNIGTDTIDEYDVNGTLVGTFVTSGLGGLSNPFDMQFGPDGNLYVSSSGTDEILRYDGTTGAFIDVFVASGDGGTTVQSLKFHPTTDELYVNYFTGGVYSFDAPGTGTEGDPTGLNLALTQSKTIAFFEDSACSESIDIIIDDNDNTDDTQTVHYSNSATFSITLENDGGVELENVAVTNSTATGCDLTWANIQDILDGTNAIGPVGDGDTIFDAGETFTYTCTNTNVTAGYTNTATVNADTTDVANTAVTDNDTSDVDMARITLDKDDNDDTDDTQTVTSGNDATFTITLTNSGEVNLENVILTDANAAACDLTWADVQDILDGTDPLGPVGNADTIFDTGETFAYTCVETGVTASFTNTASVVADTTDVDDESVNDDDTSAVVVSSSGGSSGGSSSGSGGGGGSSSVTVTPIPVSEDITYDTTIGRICGTLYMALVDDSTFNPADGETAYEGVELDLYLDVNKNGVIDGDDIYFLSNSSNMEGEFCFEDLPVLTESGDVVQYLIPTPEELVLTNGITLPIVLSEEDPEELTLDFGLLSATELAPTGSPIILSVAAGMFGIVTIALLEVSRSRKYA